MKKLFLMTVAVAALAAGTAMAADLKFQPGQDSKFNWKSFDDFKSAHADLKGETLTIFGPWRGEDEALFTSVLNYFTEATGVNAQIFVLGKLRAADRYRHAGRLSAERRDPAATGPARQPCQQGLSDAARRRSR